MKLLFSKPQLLLTFFLVILFIGRLFILGEFSFHFSFSNTGEKVIKETVSSNFDTPYEQLLEGILFGLKVRFPFELYEAMKKTGTLHLVVASGYNITVVAGFCMMLAGLIPRKISLIITLTVIFWYTSLSQFDPPVVRAAIMGGLSFMAQLTGRMKHALWSLFIVAYFMLFFQPSLLLNIGFQLSFAATAGILLLSPLFISLLKFCPVVIREEVSVALVAQITTLPILLHHFQVVSVVSLITNLFLSWVIPAVMLFGGLFVATSLALPSLAILFEVVTGGLLEYILAIIMSFSRFPYAQIKFPLLSPFIIFGLYLLMGSFVFWWWQKASLSVHSKV